MFRLHFQNRQVSNQAKRHVLESVLPAFAVCAGVSYSTARDWFHLVGFPVFRGVIFWQGFVQWRAGQNGFKNPSLPQRNGETVAAA